ncbi:MAG TPA: nucleotidyltransferase domain-containing protein [Thermomicrobiales bacterium]|nr:nucleotidyltransferase domain-containing protein [Thermomicrobiales bacterium]
MNPAIKRNLDTIQTLCRAYGVQRLDLFGSATSARFDEATSDFDFIVTFADTTMPGYLDRYLAFAEALEGALGRPIDLITERSIRSPYFRQAVEESRQPLYDDRNAPTAA